MEVPMTPSRVLEEYDILGRDIPEELISEMRERFLRLEEEGVPVWKILVDEVANIELKTEDELGQNRLWVAQACGEVMLTKKTPRNEYDEMSWKTRISQLYTPEDFSNFFTILNLNEEVLRSSKSMINAGYNGILAAIFKDPRFNGSWIDFKKFVGINDERWSTKISSCSTPADFLQLFKDEGIPGDAWQNAGWLSKNQFGGMCKAINKDARFGGSWSGFKGFMDMSSDVHITIKLSNSSKVVQCKTPNDFLELFQDEGIIDDLWVSPSQLEQEGYVGLVAAIRKDPRFNGSWIDFKKFMGINDERWSTKISSCSTPADFLQLFKDEGIPGDAWQSSKWLSGNQFSGLLRGIYYDARFGGSWSGFKSFMGVEDASASSKISTCITPWDFLRFFKSEGIPEDAWQNSRWLIDSNFRWVVHAIRNDVRFTSWRDFLDFMDPNFIMETEELERISELNLEDVIALLGSNDPQKLKIYLIHAYPELTEAEIDKLVIRSFKNFAIGSPVRKEEEYLEYECKLPALQIKAIPVATEESTVTIEGSAKGEFVYVAGVYTRKVRLAEDGSFSVRIPLHLGQLNAVRIMAVDTTDIKQKVRSGQKKFGIQQTSPELDDIDILFAQLSQLGKDAQAEIRQNPGRLEYFQQCAEQVLIKKFSRSFREGEVYITSLIDANESPVVRNVLRKTLANFRKVQRMQLPNVREGSLMFFQKYCVYEIRRRIASVDYNGVILGNDPGLGKTRTVEAIISDMEAGIICPNSVVSAWEDEGNEILVDPDLLVMRDIPHAIRERMLATRKAAEGALSPRRYVTNVEFLQNTKKQDRFKLLGGRDMVLVHDEAHTRANEHSEQSRGAKMIEHAFQINVTATPAKHSESTRKMLKTLHPNDKRFSSAKAFQRAFPTHDPEALKTLSLILRKDMIRFRKQDVMEEVDPNQSLLQQKHKLPKKEYIPSEKMGQFTMSQKQAYALYELFLDFDTWSKKYNKYIPDDETSEADRLRVGDSLTKKHAMRQVINNPAYLGLADDDKKAAEMRRVVELSLADGRKPVIFCAYNAQARKYADMFAEYKPALYTGDTSKSGHMKDEGGHTILYARENGTDGKSRGWKFDQYGYPIPCDNGEPMSALEYERHTFQNCDDRRIAIVTYKAGAVGTTFTAGKTLIKDDLPADVIEMNQAEDRIHRIDPNRLTHATAQYVTMIAKYPDAFLRKMKKVWVVKDIESQCFVEFTSRKSAENYANEQVCSAQQEESPEVQTAYEAFFQQGTYDEVHSQNLEVQRKMFHLINDGIADNAILDENKIRFKALSNGVEEVN